MAGLVNDYKVDIGFAKGVDLRNLRLSDLDELDDRDLRKAIDYVYSIVHGHGFKEGEEYGKELAGKSEEE